MRANALFERPRNKINLANQAGPVLIVDQRRASAAGVKIDLCVGQPFSDDGGELAGADALSAAIVGKMREMRLKSQANQLLGAIIFIYPGVACLRTEWKG